jgi:hypothetical protein
MLMATSIRNIIGVLLGIMLGLYALIGLLGVYSTVYVIPYETPKSAFSPFIYLHMALGGLAAVGSLLFLALSSAVGDKKLTIAAGLNLGSVASAGVGGMFFLVQRLSFEQFNLPLTFLMLAGFVSAVTSTLYGITRYALRYRSEQLIFPLALASLVLSLVTGGLGLKVSPVVGSLQGYPIPLFIHVILGALTFFSALALSLISISKGKMFFIMTIINLLGVGMASIGGMLYAGLALQTWQLMLSGFIISAITDIAIVFESKYTRGNSL